MTNFNLNQQVTLVRYGLPALRILLLFAFICGAQFYFVELTLKNGGNTTGDNPALFNLNRKLSDCLQQLQEASGDQQKQNSSDSANTESNNPAETGNQRFLDSKGAWWIFNGEEKKWLRHP